MCMQAYDVVGDSQMSDAIRSQVEQKACKLQFGLVVTKPTSRLVAAAEVDLQVS